MVRAIAPPANMNAAAVGTPNRGARMGIAISTGYGEAYRNVVIIPMGMPAFTMLARIGIVEQEQKGVTQPSPIAAVWPTMPFLPLSPWRSFSGEMYSSASPERNVTIRNSGINSTRMVRKNCPERSSVSVIDRLFAFSHSAFDVGEHFLPGLHGRLVG